MDQLTRDVNINLHVFCASLCVDKERCSFVYWQLHLQTPYRCWRQTSSKATEWRIWNKLTGLSASEKSKHCMYWCQTHYITMAWRIWSFLKQSQNINKHILLPEQTQVSRQQEYTNCSNKMVVSNQHLPLWKS